MSETKINLTAETAVACMIVAAETALIAQDYVAAAETAMIKSAVETARTILGGVQAKAIADAARAAVKADPRLKGRLYISPAAVGYHARLGRVIMIDAGDDGTETVLMPTREDGSPVTVQDLQTLIKGLSTATVDAVIASDKVLSVADAWAALERARKAAARKPRADKVPATDAGEGADSGEGDDAGEGSPATGLVPATLTDLLRGVLSRVLDAGEAGETLSGEDETLAREVVSVLSAALDAVTPIVAAA